MGQISQAQNAILEIAFFSAGLFSVSWVHNLYFSESSGKKRKHLNPFKKMKRFFSSRMKKGKDLDGEPAVPVGFKAKSTSDVLGAHRGEITEDRSGGVYIKP